MKKSIIFLIIVSVVAVVLAVVIGHKSILKNVALTITVQLVDVKPAEVDFSEIEKRAERAIYAIDNDLLSMQDFHTLDSLLAILFSKKSDSAQFMGYLMEIDQVLGVNHVQAPADFTNINAQ